jgi:potassium channel subfamily K
LARETVLEAIEVGYRKRVREVQKRRRILTRERRIFRRWRAAVEYRLNQLGQPVWVDDPVHEHTFFGHLFDKLWPWPRGNGPFFRYDTTLGYGEHAHPHNMHLNLEALSWPQLESAAMEAGAPLHTLLPPGFRSKKPLPSQPHPEPRDDATQPRFEPSVPEPSDVPLTHARLGRMSTLLSNFALAVNHTQFSRVPQRVRPVPLQLKLRTTSLSQSRRPVPEQYESLRNTMEKEERRAFIVRLCSVWLIFLIFWTVCSRLFSSDKDSLANV